MKTDAAVEAIKYAITLGVDASTFLTMWLHGEFAEIREEWADCPSSIFSGAEVLPNFAYTYRAQAYSVECPKCDFELTGLLCNPCGLSVDCDQCGNTFSVSENAQLEEIP
jgi:hypothetical protein